MARVNSRRRNPPQDALTKPAKGDPARPYPFWGALDNTPYVYVATMVNPKDRRPYMILADGDKVRVAHPNDADDGTVQVVGRGYFGSEDESIDACPRTHTPAGVSAKGVGLGTMLYFGLALASVTDEPKRADEWFAENEDFVADPCVSSKSDQRSDAASEWWRSAASRGDAEEIEGDEECERRDTPVSFDLDDEHFEGALEEGHTVGRHQRSVEVDAWYEDCHTELGYKLGCEIPFRRGVVLHWGAWRGLVKLARAAAPGDEYQRPPMVDARILSSLDMRACRSPGLLALVQHAMVERGIPWKSIVEWQTRNVPAWYSGSLEWPQPLYQAYDVFEGRPLKHALPRYNPIEPHFDAAAWTAAFGPEESWPSA